MNDSKKVRRAIPKRLSSSTKSKLRRSRPLKVENLEGRRLMAATWGLSGGELTINADPQGSQVVVRDLNPMNDRYSPMWILVTATSDNGSWTIPLAKPAVQHVNFVGSGTEDEFTLNTGYRFAGLVQPSPGAASFPITGHIDGRYGNDTLTGGMGNDIIIGGSGLDRIEGKGGHDTIYGDHQDAAFFDGDTSSSGSVSGAVDEIYGGPGNDIIHGGGQNDLIDGGRGNDKLYGGYGHDKIHGGEGRDSIYGQYGNDDLYGGAGIDMLYGGSGGDGLYGGYGLDGLTGGIGADRFLVHDSPSLSLDVVIDNEARDATIHFRDGETQFLNMGSDVGWVEVVGAQWSEDDIELADSAFKSLHRVVGNTRLLETAEGASTEIDRYGTIYNATKSADGSFIRGATNKILLGWNTPDSPSFAIVQNSFDLGDDEIHSTIFHEIGHNWDEASESSFADEFSAVAGWREFDGGAIPAAYEKGRDKGETWGNWYFFNRDTSLDGFAHTYGKTNPAEDFATSFAAFMMAQTGRNYESGLTIDGLETPDEIGERLEDRFDVLYRFLGQMGARNRWDWPT